MEPLESGRDREVPMRRRPRPKKGGLKKADATDDTDSTDITD